MVVTRAGTWSRGPPLEWAHRLGASPPKRMADSWSGSDAGPTEYKVAARCYAPKWRAPLGSYSALPIRRSRSREKGPAERNQLDTCRMAPALGPGCSAGSCRLMRSATAMAGRVKAMTRAASRVWSAGPGATSWCRCRGLRRGTISTPGWRSNAASVRRPSCGATPRRSDFRAIPSLNKMQVLELARCEWVERRENVIALGPSGTGKTHVALGLGLAACQKGLAVGFTTAAALVHELMEAGDERRLLRLQKQLVSHKLLIIAELGFVPLSKTGAELLFELISQRYERGATMITSNLPFDEWTETFGSPNTIQCLKIGTAASQRAGHRCDPPALRSAACDQRRRGESADRLDPGRSSRRPAPLDRAEGH